MSRDPDGVASVLAEIAVEAGLYLAAVADRGAGRVVKPDGSPATAADVEAERLVVARLAERYPDIPVVAEEAASEGAPAIGRRFFLVDPLDGTRDYLTGSGEYSVNVALVEGDRPVAAALAVPVLGRVWAAGLTARVAELAVAGAGLAWTSARVRPVPASGPVALVSRRHGDPETERCLDALPVRARFTVSSAAKFGLIASGEADVYVRCGPTMEWDTAAGDHIVTAAGGCVLGPGREPLRYGQSGRGFRNGAFVALGDATLAAALPAPFRRGP